ncbi:hypothetical protein MKX01_024628 [Papaver californicum]|nr:hypothetical protein MKX01_024628 [Papaver californicum]
MPCFSCLNYRLCGSVFSLNIQICNKEVTEAIQKIAAAYGCKIVEGLLVLDL